jgi:hypothetical protein
MKPLICTVVVAALVVPALSFAQSNRLAADVPSQAGVTQSQTEVDSENSVSGHVADALTGVSGNEKNIAGHSWLHFLRGNGAAKQPNDGCVGPVSFCNIYFGS